MLRAPAAWHSSTKRHAAGSARLLCGFSLGREDSEAWKSRRTYVGCVDVWAGPLAGEQQHVSPVRNCLQNRPLSPSTVKD